MSDLSMIDHCFCLEGDSVVVGWLEDSKYDVHLLNFFYSVLFHVVAWLRHYLPGNIQQYFVESNMELVNARTATLTHYRKVDIDFAIGKHRGEVESSDTDDDRFDDFVSVGAEDTATENMATATEVVAIVTEDIATEDVATATADIATENVATATVVYKRRSTEHKTMGTPYGDIILYQGDWGNVTDEDEGDSDDLPVSQYMDTKEQDLIAMEIELNKKENRLNKKEKRLDDWEKRLNKKEKRLNILRKNMEDIFDGEEE